jgi:hypothetical protein
MLDAFFIRMNDKYEDEFNWHRISETNTSFIKELHAELKHGHPLYGRAASAVAKCDSNDNVLFSLLDGYYAIVHLTYSTCNTGGFPQFDLFPNFQDASAYIEKQFASEYQHG